MSEGKLLEMWDEAFRDECIDVLCKISDQNCDPVVKDTLRKMKGRTNAEVEHELLMLIDDIVAFALTSSFELTALQVMWTCIGGTPEKQASRENRGGMGRTMSAI